MSNFVDKDIEISSDESDEEVSDKEVLDKEQIKIKYYDS